MMTIRDALAGITLGLSMAMAYALARLGYFVLVMFLCASSVRAQDVTAPTTPRAKWYTVTEWAVIGAHAGDLATSQRVFGSGRGHEANAFLAQFDDPLGFAAAKFGIVFAQLWGTRELARAGHPKVAATLNASIAGVLTGVTVSNWRVYRSLVRDGR